MLEKLKVGILGLYDDLYLLRPPPTPIIRTRLTVHLLSSTSVSSPGQCTPRLSTPPEPEPRSTLIRRPPIIPKPIRVPERSSTSPTSPNAVRFLPDNREPVRSFLSPRSFESITPIPELPSLRFAVIPASPASLTPPVPSRHLTSERTSRSPVWPPLRGKEDSCPTPPRSEFRIRWQTTLTHASHYPHLTKVPLSSGVPLPAPSDRSRMTSGKGGTVKAIYTPLESPSAGMVAVAKRVGSAAVSTPHDSAMRDR
jgi:hypothetical protein